MLGTDTNEPLLIIVQRLPHRDQLLIRLHKYTPRNNHYSYSSTQVPPK